MVKGLIGTSGNKKVVMKMNTLWSKTEVSVLAFFVKNNNRVSTYRDIARAYVNASYSNYQKACEELVKRGYLVKTEENAFRVRQSIFANVQRGTETIEMPIPHFNAFLKRVKRVK